MEDMILNMVRSTVDVEKVPAGTLGTIVGGYKSGRAFEVEFRVAGKSYVLTMTPDQFEVEEETEPA